MQLCVTLKLTLPMQGHWGGVRYIYIGSAADGVMDTVNHFNESYSRVSVIRVNGA